MRCSIATYDRSARHIDTAVSVFLPDVAGQTAHRWRDGFRSKPAVLFFMLRNNSALATVFAAEQLAGMCLERLSFASGQEVFLVNRVRSNSVVAERRIDSAQKPMEISKLLSECSQCASWSALSSSCY